MTIYLYLNCIFSKFCARIHKNQSKHYKLYFARLILAILSTIFLLTQIGSNLFKNNFLFSYYL